MYKSPLQSAPLTTVWAAGAFALSLAFMLPAQSNAVDDTSVPGQNVVRIANTQLDIHGVHFTVVADSPSTQPSAAPDSSAAPAVSSDGKVHFAVRARNDTSAPASGKFAVQLFAAYSGNPMARTPPIPVQIWTDSGNYDLKSGENKLFSFTSGPVPTGKILILEMASSDGRVRVASLSDNP